VCGGHTEITAGLERPIVVGQMLGEAPKDGALVKTRLEPGDRILLTHGAAIEGTALLAREKPAALEGAIRPELLERARQLLFAPGISVVEAARVARAAAPVRAMHDPTEGGIVTALWEFARAGGRGLRVEAECIPILPETEAVCRALGLDPLKLIASGALLIAVRPSDTTSVISALEASGVPAAEVARVVPATEGTRIRVMGRWEALEPASRDEIARVFGNEE
jgi:hydrogenase expression/formation protein HypE